MISNFSSNFFTFCESTVNKQRFFFLKYSKKARLSSLVPKHAFGPETVFNFLGVADLSTKTQINIKK